MFIIEERSEKKKLFENFEVCSNGSRIFVHRSIATPFIDEFIKATSQLVIGDPLDERTQVGASISQAHAEKVLTYINSAVKEVELNV